LARTLGRASGLLGSQQPADLRLSCAQRTYGYLATSFLCTSRAVDRWPATCPPLGSIYMVHICCMNGCCRLFRSGSNDQSITIFASASWERETPCLILESTSNDRAWYIVLMRMHVHAGSFNLSSLTCVGQPAGIPSVWSTCRDRYCAILRQMFLKKNLLARSPQFYPSFIHSCQLIT
jgi:hypothetical protein